MIRKMLCFVLAGFSMPIWGASLKMKEEDQQKLAAFVSKLPLSVRRKEIFSVTQPINGIKVRSEFPKGESSFKIYCESYYFNGSNYASYGDCRLEVDKENPEVETRNAEVQIEILDSRLVDALFKGMTYERELKEMRSWGKEWTTNFDGRVGHVFDYYLSCTMDKCRLKLSSRNLR